MGGRLRPQRKKKPETRRRRRDQQRKGISRRRSLRSRAEFEIQEYSYSNIIDIAQSEQLSGTKGWKLLQVELDTAEESYVMPQFVLYGLGRAWFDDAKLEKLKG